MIVVFGLWFWVIIAAVIILEIILVEYEKPIVGMLVLGGALAAFHFWSDVEWMQWIADHPLHFLGGLVGYVVVGVLWGVFKWFLYIKEFVYAYQQQRQQWLTRKGVKNAKLDTVVPENLRKEWNEDHRYRRSDTDPPHARQNKERIITWMGFWPWSMLWSLVRDPFQFIYRAIAVRLEKMSEKIYQQAGYDEDQQLPAEPPLEVGFEEKHDEF